MVRGWEGEKTRLVPLEKKKHLENAILWMSDPEITRWLLVGDFPISRLQEEKWFDEMNGGGGKNVAFAIETRDGTHVGFTGIHDIAWPHGTGRTGTVIAPAEAWGKGLGSDAIGVRTRYAFEVLGLRLLLSEVIDGNERSRRTLAKAGYAEVGRVPGRYWKRGAFRDALLFCMEKPGGA